MKFTTRQFNIIQEALKQGPDKKITVIKTVREASGMGLKESKDWVESYLLLPHGPVNPAWGEFVEKLQPDDEIAFLEAKIQNLEIKVAESNGYDIEALRERIKVREKDMATLEDEISRLNGKNAELEDANRYLRSELDTSVSRNKILSKMVRAAIEE